MIVGRQAGWYVVTQDTPNPIPDRRSQWFMNRPVWKAGTRVKLRSLLRGDKEEPPETLLLAGIIEGTDGTQVRFGGDGKTESQGNGLLENLQPEPERLGFIIKDQGAQDSDVLAILVQTGVVTLDQVKKALADLEALGDDEYDQFRRHHAI